MHRDPRAGPALPRRITGFHQDEEGHWVAEFECGHTQHVRHDPPWQVRPWVTTPEGRTSRLGTVLECIACAAGDVPEGGSEGNGSQASGPQASGPQASGPQASGPQRGPATMPP